MCAYIYMYFFLKDEQKSYFLKRHPCRKNLKCKFRATENFPGYINIFYTCPSKYKIFVTCKSLIQPNQFFKTFYGYSIYIMLFLHGKELLLII